jgi:transcriptional regulator with XRE-family HTH domain
MPGGGPHLVTISEQMLQQGDVKRALRERDFGAVFALMTKYLGATQTELAAATGLTQARISKLMCNPKERIVHIDVVERIANGLRIPGSMLGLSAQPWELEDDDGGRPGGDEDPLLRRDILRIGGILLTGSVIPSALDSEPDAMQIALETSSISEERLIQLERAANYLGVEVVRVAPARVLTPALTCFRSIRRAVQERLRTRQRVRLIRAGAKLATIVGEILFNENNFTMAHQWYTTARNAAVDIGDKYLADIALAGSTYLPTYSDAPREVLSLVKPRLDQGYSPTPAIAWLWGFKAKAHAALGEHDAAVRAIDRAQETLAGSAEHLIGPGIFSFVPEKLALYKANMYVSLGEPELAANAANEALGLYDMTETTEPALARFERASALVEAGEIQEACRFASATILDPRTYPSITVRKRAAKFDRLLGKGAAPGVREWREIMVAHCRPQVKAITA